MFVLYLFRCRKKQRKEASCLQAMNRKLTAMNKLLMEEKHRLQKQMSQLVYENGYFRQQTQPVGLIPCLITYFLLRIIICFLFVCLFRLH